MFPEFSDIELIRELNDTAAALEDAHFNDDDQMILCCSDYICSLQNELKTRGLSHKE